MSKQALRIREGGPKLYVTSFVIEVSLYGFNFAGIATARRYFGEMNDYAWLQIGTGVSPDESRNIQFTTNQRLYSNRVTIGIRKSIQRKHLLIFHTGYSRDEYQPKTFGNQYFGSIGYARRF